MIVVVGAGIGGLAAALACATFDEVVVCERRTAAAANAGAGIQLSPNAVKALAALGVATEEWTSAPDGLVVAAAGRRSPLVRVDYAPLADRYGAPSLTASRAALHLALLATARQHGVEIRHDRAASRLAPDGDRIALPELGLAADLVVAADGVASDLRTALDGSRPEDTGAVAWRGRARHGGRDTVLTLAAGAHLVRYGIDEGDNVVLVTSASREPCTLARTALGPLLADVEDWTPWPIRVRPHAFARGRIGFVGDAAHAMPPYLAQGAAMALEDAAVLRLALDEHGPAERALLRYAAARASRVRRVARDTARQGALYHLRTPLSLGRDAVMARLGPAAVLRRVDWLYSWSPTLGDAP